MSDRFVEIVPKHIIVPPIVGLDVDAQCSLALFTRMQQPQEVGFYDPAILLQHRLGEQISIPVKAPGTHMYVPDIGMPHIFQDMANYRFTTSVRYNHEWMHLVFDQSDVVRGEPARQTEGKHIDDVDQSFIEGRGRVSAAFIMVSDFPTIWYDGVRQFSHAAFATAADNWNMLAAKGDHYEAGEARNQFFDELVYPRGGYTKPAGTLMFMTGAVLHEVAIADRSARRGFLLLQSWESESPPYKSSELAKLNPALAKAVYG